MYGQTTFFFRRLVWVWAAAILGLAPAARAEAPAVVFDLPLTVECRDVTPKRYEESYRRKIVEAVIKLSPRLLAGDERDLKKLHYEISSEQQMPVVGYAPNSQVTSDVADGTIAIQTDDHHGQLLVHYLITPAAGDGKITADLNSSHAQYRLLAPKQILLAAGTIERGCGVYYDLKPTTQDTLQKQREFACLFDVPATWRANYLTVRCNAKAAKRGLLGESEVNAGMGMLSIGLYKQDDAEAMALAYELGRKQQRYLDRLAEDTKGKLAKNERAASLPDFFVGVQRAFSGGTKMHALDGHARTGVGAALQAQVSEDKALQAGLSTDTRDASDQLSAAKEALRQLNGRP